jgi:outer membrane cobalamin receptor
MLMFSRTAFPSAAGFLLITLSMLGSADLTLSAAALAQPTVTVASGGTLTSIAPTPGALQELQLLHEETVVTAARHEQPLSEAPANVYVITDEDIRHSGATDLPTLLRRVPGIEVMQVSGADFNVSARGNNQLSANKLLVLVDGRSIYNDVQGAVF